MKKMDKAIKARDVVLIFFAMIVLVGLAYYRYVYEPTTTQIAEANKRRDELELEVMQAQGKVSQLQKMQDELDEIGMDADRMESYNNAKAEISLLNNCLMDANSYNISFTNLTRNGNQIRRNFSLDFTTENFESARRILTKLTASQYRCLLGDMSYTNGVDSSTGESFVNISLTATFYETMVGGTPDAGLPIDSSVVAG
ncbi:MAG: hypothetical protein E7474_12965 [Ruminococcaceae bacterium]|nr:hypothetical protein [Oscillospiraceae bacterium]